MEARQTKARPLVFVVVLLLSSSFLVLAVAGARIAYAQSTSVTVVCSPAGTQTDPLTEGSQSRCTATVTGQSTPGPTGNVVWVTGLGAAENAGFSSTTCALSGGACSVTYTVPSCPPACNSVVIYGNYQGNANNTASTGTFTLFVSSSTSSSTSSSSTSTSSSSSSSSTGSSPSSVSLTVPPARVDYGWSAHFTAVVGNVPSGFNYTIEWSAGPGTPACGTPPLQSSSSDNFTTPPLTPSQTPSIVRFCAYLDAGSLGTALANATATVNPALVAPVISVSPTTVNVGQTATLTITTPFSGGTPPYACQWLEWNPELGRFIIDGNAFACAPTSSPTVSTGNLSAAGTWQFEFKVTDNASQPMTVASSVVTIAVGEATNTSTSTASSGNTTNGDLDWLILFGVIGGSAAAVIAYWYFFGGDEDTIPHPEQDEKEYEPPWVAKAADFPVEDTFMEDLEKAIASTAPPEELPVPPTLAPSVPVSPPAAAPTTAPPLGPSPPNPAAPGPCADAMKAWDDASDELQRLEKAGQPTADAYKKEREARARYLKCISD